MKQKFNTVEEYISAFPEDVQAVLIKIRDLIFANAPQVTEGIAYGMPAYKTNNKPLVYFAAYEKHIGFYATPSGHEKFKKELSAYKQGKGSVQFPIDQPIPFGVITEIIKFRVNENNQW